MKRKLIAIAIAALSATAVAGAQNSFAIVVDSESYKNCKTELEDYRESVANGGLNAFILEKNWSNPEEIKEALMTVRQQARDEMAAAAAPKAAVTCPYCGATTTPDASGCCEYCGGAVNG